MRLTDPTGKDWRDFLVGVVHSIGSNATLGAAEGLTKTDIVSDAGDYNSGRLVGDVVSILTGGQEIGSGIGGVVVGVAGTPESLGLSLSISAAGAVGITHGAGVIGRALNSLSTGQGRMSETSSNENLGGGKSKDGNGKPTRNDRIQEKKAAKENKRNKPSSESKYNQEAEHTSNASPSKRQKHQDGQSRKQIDKGGEKGDERRKRYK